MKIYFIVDDFNFHDWDDYMDTTDPDFCNWVNLQNQAWAAHDVYKKINDESWVYRSQVKSGLRAETTYYSLDDALKETKSRDNYSGYSWSIICEADVDDDYMIPKGPYLQEENYRRLVAPLPKKYKAVSLVFHRTLEGDFKNFLKDYNNLTKKEVEQMEDAFVAGWEASKSLNNK